MMRRRKIERDNCTRNTQKCNDNYIMMYGGGGATDKTALVEGREG